VGRLAFDLWSSEANDPIRVNDAECATNCISAKLIGSATYAQEKELKVVLKHVDGEAQILFTSPLR
jgi:hypothetical protein